MKRGSIALTDEMLATALKWPNKGLRSRMLSVRLYEFKRVGADEFAGRALAVVDLDDV